MRWFFSLLLPGLFYAGSAFSQSLTAYFNYNKFWSPETGPYVETYLTIVGYTAEYAKNEHGLPQANVEVTMILKKDTGIADFKKYVLKSPPIVDSLIPDFVDQQRFSVSNGHYELEIEMKDLHNPVAKPFAAIQKIEINTPPEAASVSDIQLLENYAKSDQPGPFTKSGYDLVPIVSNYYPEGFDVLKVYAEIYNTDKAGADKRYLMRYYIESYETEKMLHSFSGFQKIAHKPVNVLLTQLNIEALGTGNYNFVLELRDHKNQLIARKKSFFQRNKQLLNMKLETLSAVRVENTWVAAFTEKDSLLECIYSCRPLSTDMEKHVMDYQLNPHADLELMQQYFYSFWYNRNNYEPEITWRKYNEEVQKVEKLFGTPNKKGYQTDQGYVYLRYGAPNTVSDRSNEPSSLPYQIWHFYKVGRYNNRRFIFYNPHLINEYTLLHSDVPGEPKDYRWKFRLQSRDNPDGNLDNSGTGQNHYGNRVDDFFLNPR